MRRLKYKGAVEKEVKAGMKRFGGDKKYLYWGLTAFAVIACSIVFYMLLSRWSGVAKGFSAFIHVIAPFIWGFAITYLLRPAMVFFERNLTEPLGDRLFKNNHRRAFGFGRALAIVIVELLMICIVSALLWLILPQIYSSINSIVSNSQSYFETIEGWVRRTFEDYPELMLGVTSLLDSASGQLTQWATNTLLPQMTNIISSITSGVYTFVRGIYYIAVGIIVSFYVLFNKEAVATGAKRVLYCIFTVEAAEKILEGVRFTDKTFMDFISGKLLDSAIIGILCYICCSLMRMPYTLLISVIVGVTNVIPFFGPFIGAFPSAFIILLVDPMKCLLFLFFILILQQFDGNILGPKILGSSTGVNGFWIMFAIIVGGGFFGFMGMLLGVPVFVVIYTGVKSLTSRKLRRSGLPTDYESYENLHHIDPKTGENVEMPPEPTAEERRAKKAASRAEAKAAGAARAERLRRLINKNARSGNAPDDEKHRK
jgi:predicted PurR-regulated permease PerM